MKFGYTLQPLIPIYKVLRIVVVIFLDYKAFLVMTILTGIHLFHWISPGHSGYPWPLLFWVLGMFIFGTFLFDRKAKLIIDNDALTIQHEEQSRIEIASILTGYVHSVSRHNRSIFSKPDYYLTLISKNPATSTHVDISGLELNGWEIGAFLNFKMSKTKSNNQ
ncbi:hypothetical protein [Marinifilum caeruleilacunae]|uniref:DUF304 domain-containing protein n=1 Tax=Marinifilum caeruleilacunae TaxID=2499076 RepID=A0ABX1X1G9_9BACT|nr:hypothetical protein [Marinifilum caeruleilacunae]NOU62132.1 hypothetical protein [Marinifilum caeruleilacunae]